jgi:hypothetical protein
MEILIPVSIGELVDKITILEIKSEKIKDAAKVESVNKELKLLQKEFAKLTSHTSYTAFLPLKEELLRVNQTLWAIEDELRDLEKMKIFNADFIENARKVYITNDHRFRVKSQINNLFGSIVREVKSYKDY